MLRTKIYLYYYYRNAYISQHITCTLINLAVIVLFK